MSQHKSDSEMIRDTHNTARFFVETRQIAWVLLIGTAVWGVYGYVSMPQRKDPDIPVRVAVALTPWPGASAERVEQLVTRKVEEKVGQNSHVAEIKSISRTGLSVVYLELDQRTSETGKELDDVKLKLDQIHDLPDLAGPIQFIKDFGDTAALMLTVASPKVSGVEVTLRARSIQRAIEEARRNAGAGFAGSRASFVVSFPQSMNLDAVRRSLDLSTRWTRERGLARDLRTLQGPGFLALDFSTTLSDREIQESADRLVRERLQASDFHPDHWNHFVVRDPSDAAARLAAAAGAKYSYRELDDFTDLIEKTLKTVPQVSRVTRSGLLQEQVFLMYSQERLASYGIATGNLDEILQARNTTLPGGTLESQGRNLVIDPSGEFKNEREIGDVLLTSSGSGSPLYLRDLVDIVRGYENPQRYTNYYLAADSQARWQRNRAVTMAIQMREGEQISAFGEAVDAALNSLRPRLPADLIMARTSDQPAQVRENVDLFMKSLYEAILLVVVVSLIGFREWRSAVLMALSIPITLAMTYGMMHMLGIDLQQVSIATLIIALGLLVDDPVVAGDAIKRELAAGHGPLVASWLGPTKLANAILFATITNIVAYLPFLMLSGDTGRFLYSLPVVIACSLIASRIVSMTFIPLLGYYLLKPKAEAAVEERRRSGFASFYYRAGAAAIHHRWKFLPASFVILAAGGFFASGLKTQFFPKDLSYLSFVDVWLPEDAPLSATDRVAERAEAIIRRVANEYGRQHRQADGRPRQVLQSLTTFVGGGGPRFWFSVSPELQQLNYAQILIQVADKHDTAHLIDPMQRALSSGIPGARIDVRQLETGKTVGLPVQIRVSGDNIALLREQAERIKSIFRAIPAAERVRDDWGEQNFTVKLRIDPDRANLAGVTNFDVAAASVTAVNGYRVATLREGERQIPIVARLRMEQRSRLADIQNLYVYSSRGPGKIPLRQVSSIGYEMQTEKTRRLNQFRTITVACFPAAGTLPSEVLGAAMPRLREFSAALPPGYKMEIAGEYKDQQESFAELALVMGISVAMIFLTLVVQFRNAVKPFIVFAAIPYGMAGALGALWIMGAPFGFMAFLGIASLVGVVVSHVIVLFDFIEERHAEGHPLVESLLDAGIMRLRPVLITVGATVIALYPLASHGGPLWEPLCYAQIGGLTVATFVTLVLVPVLYAIFVLDLKLVSWSAPPNQRTATARA
ncbi:MAG: efflux RND transporter permease subunit [Bryobacterales bacterium]|nr:efflux RND transporter permease subunit [Bryobacterales bacterium]